MSLLSNLHHNLNQVSEGFCKGLIPSKYWSLIDDCDVYGNSIKIEFKKNKCGGGVLDITGYSGGDFRVEATYVGNNQLACLNFYTMIAEIIRSIEFNEVEASKRQDT